MPVLDISTYKPEPDTGADANEIANGLQAIADVVNALDQLNFGAGKIFDPAKLMQSGAGTGDVLAWDGAEWAPGGAGASATPSGLVADYAGPVAPSGWLACDGSSQLRATYAALFGALVLSKGSCTISIASPGVVTKVAHGLVVGDAVYFTTSGALPTGLTADTTYYVAVVGSADTFQVAATRGGAAINTSGSQSGVHTLFHAPHGVADATHFNLPDYRGRKGIGQSVGGHADVLAIGQNDGVTLASRRPKHKHTVNDPTHSHTSPNWASGSGGFGTGWSNDAAGTNTPLGTNAVATGVTIGPQTGSEPTDAEPYLVVQKIIKT